MDRRGAVCTWMTQPAIEASPRSRMMKAMTNPADITTNICDILLFVTIELVSSIDGRKRARRLTRSKL